jgi:hypothetical protein
MGICDSKLRKGNAIAKPELLDENQSLNFDVVLSQLQGRNFKKVCLLEKHLSADSVW